MKTKTAVTPPAANLASNGTAKRLLMMALPVIVAVLLLFVPVPDGLPPYAWHYFAIFVGVIVGLIFEPLPGAVIGLTGLDLARHFAKRRAGMDRDIRSEAAVRHNVVERSFVPLYSDFKLSFHLVFPFVIGRSSARAVPHKKSRPWVRTGIDIVSSNDSFAINNAIPVRFW